jgi:peptidylprolyl isomerase
MRLVPLAAALLALPAPSFAQDAEPPTPASVIAAAPASDWRAIEPADLLVMTLAPDRDGHAREVVIQLMPPPFSQGWVGNVRTLANAHWWDGTSVYRVVDNWVAQWGDVDEAKPLPEGVVSPEMMSWFGTAVSAEVLPITWTDAGQHEFGQTYGSPVIPWPGPYGRLRLADPYSTAFGFKNGFPIGLGFPPGIQFRTPPMQPMIGWPLHCYGSVGVARDLESTGTGSELYAVIGHAPRQLDRNIAVVGRVIEGIEHLSTLPRGKGEAGVYDDPALRVPIISVRLMSELLEEESEERGLYIGGSRWPSYQYLSTESDSFAKYAHVRANRHDDFYKVPAGGVDICNLPVPVRGLLEQ